MSAHRPASVEVCVYWNASCSVTVRISSTTVYGSHAERQTYSPTTAPRSQHSPSLPHRQHAYQIRGPLSRVGVWRGGLGQEVGPATAQQHITELKPCLQVAQWYHHPIRWLQFKIQCLGVGWGGRRGDPFAPLPLSLQAYKAWLCCQTWSVAESDYFVFSHSTAKP